MLVEITSGDACRLIFSKPVCQARNTSALLTHVYLPYSLLECVVIYPVRRLASW